MQSVFMPGVLPPTLFSLSVTEMLLSSCLQLGEEYTSAPRDEQLHIYGDNAFLFGLPDEKVRLAIIARRQDHYLANAWRHLSCSDF